MKRFFPLLLLMADGANQGGGGPPADAGSSSAESQIADLQAQLAAANKKIAKLEGENRDQRELLAETELPDDVEKQVREKVAAGLTRQQALEVIRNQALWDKQQADEAKKAAKK